MAHDTYGDIYSAKQGPYQLDFSAAADFLPILMPTAPLLSTRHLRPTT